MENEARAPFPVSRFRFPAYVSRQYGPVRRDRVAQLLRASRRPFPIFNDDNAPAKFATEPLRAEVAPEERAEGECREHGVPRLR